MILEPITDGEERDDLDEVARGQFTFADSLHEMNPNIPDMFAESQEDFDWREMNERQDELQPFILDFDKTADDSVKGWVSEMQGMDQERNWKGYIQNNAVIAHYMDADGLDDEIKRGIKRDMVAQEHFNGVGVGDEEAFNGAAVKHFTVRKDQKEMLSSLESEAMKTSVSRGGITEYAKTFQEWKAENVNRPSYDPKKEAVYLKAWQSSEKRISELVAPFRGELNAVWENMVSGKEYENAPKVAEENIPAFMAALKLRVNTLPQEQQPAFWMNFSKQWVRDANGIVNNIGNAGELLANSVPVGASVGNAGGGLASLISDAVDDFNINKSDEYSKMAAGAETQRKQRLEAVTRQKDFEADIRRIAQGSYDPVKAVFGDDRPWMNAIEKGVYAMPGAIATSAVAMIPIAGLPMTFAHLQQSSYHDLRHKMLDNGATRDEARDAAGGLSMVVAAPQMVLEKLGASALVGKLPFFNKSLTAIGNKIGGGLAGAGFRIGNAAFQETGIEMAQDLWADAVQDMGQAIAEDMPDVQWQGKGGVWDGFWKDSVTAFVAVAPLSIFAGGGQFQADQVTAAHAGSTDAQLRAYGYGQSAIDAMREAEKKGVASHMEAIQAATPARDPNSEDAKAAVVEIEAEAKAQQALIEQAEALGIKPRFMTNEDGTITVIDSITNEEIATVQNATEAAEVAFEKMAIKEEDKANAIGALAGMLTTMQSQSTDGSGTGRATRFDFRPFEKRSAKKQIEMNPESAAKIFEELGIAEGMQHGAALNGSFIKGFSNTTFEDDVYTTTNTILGGGDIFTTFHEDAHGMRRKAIRDGRMTRDEQVLGFRAINAGLQKVRGKNAPRLFLLNPETGEAVADEDVTETMLDEAFSELMESEVLRAAKLGGEAAKSTSTRAIGELSKALDAGAAMSPLFAKAVNKMRGMMRYLRAKYEVVFNRALAVNAAIERGDIDQADYHAFIDKLSGRDDVVAADTQAVETAREVIDGVDRVTYDDGSVVDEPFSIGHNAGEISGNEFQKIEGQSLLTRVLDHLKNNLSVDHPTLNNVLITRTGVKKSIAKGLGRKKAAAFYVLPEIIRMGRVIDRQKNWKGRGYDTAALATNLQVDGIPHIVFTIIKKTDAQRYELHEVMSLENSSGDLFQNPDFKSLTKSPEMKTLIENYFASKQNSDDNSTSYSIQKRIDKQFPKGQSNKNISHSEQLDALQQLAAKLAADPERKRAMLKRAADNLNKQRKEVARDVRAFGKNAKTKVLSEERKRAEIQREANMRQALRRDELEDQIYAKHQGILSQPELATLAGMPVHQYLRSPNSTLKGRLRGRGATAKMQKDKGMDENLAEYDGSDGVNRTVFGGNESPDQIAQALYDNGLIRQPTADALWEALKKEQNSVDGMKEAMRKAKAELATAKVTARNEAKKWQADQMKEQKLDHSLHARIIRGFGMLDGIMTALPAEVRGRVGIHTKKLASIKGDEARLAYLSTAMNRAAEEMEKHLQREFTKDFKEILEKSKPKGKAGEKAKSDMGAAANRFVDKVRLYWKLDEKEIEATQSNIDKEIEDTGDAARLAELGEEFQIVTMFGNFAKKSAADMELALERIRAVIKAGKNQWGILEEARLANVANLVTTARKESGDGDATDVQDSKSRSGEKGNMITQGRWNLMSFREVLDKMFGTDSVIAKTWGKAYRQAFASKAKAIILHENAWRKAMENATGMKGGAARRAVWDMQTLRDVQIAVTKQSTETLKVPIDTFFDAENQKALGLTAEEIAELTAQFEGLKVGSRKKYLTLERTTTGKPRDTNFTEAELIHLSMLWAQDDYKEGLEMNGYGVEFQEKLEEKLSDGAKYLREYMAQRYEQDFPAMRDLYSRMYGIDLAAVENYAPGTFYSRGGADTKIDLTQGIVDGGGFKQNFLKQRKRHTATPRAENAFDVFLGHVAQAEHWKALAELSREVNGVLGNPDVKISLEAKSIEGARVFAEWTQAIQSNGVPQKRPSAVVQWLITSQAYGAMAWKASTALKNGIGSAVNMAFHMPLGAYLQGMGRMLSPTGSGIALFREMWNSDMIQNQVQGGYSPEARAAISKSLFEKPSLAGDFLLEGMKIHAYSDAFGSAIGAAVCYDYHLRQALKTMPESDAKAYALDMAAEGLARVRQPVEIIDRSLMELNMNSFGKLAFLYASEIRQKSSMYVSALGNTMTGKASKKDMKVIAMMHLVVAPLMWAISSGMRDMTDDGEDDELFDDKNWNIKDLAIDIATAGIGGLPFVREIASFSKGFEGGNSPIKNMYDAGESTVDMIKDGEVSEKKLLKAVSGLGGTAATTANIYKQAVGATRNITGGDE